MRARTDKQQDGWELSLAGKVEDDKTPIFLTAKRSTTFDSQEVKTRSDSLSSGISDSLKEGS